MSFNDDIPEINNQNIPLIEEHTLKEHPLMVMIKKNSCIICGLLVLIFYGLFLTMLVLEQIYLDDQVIFLVLGLIMMMAFIISCFSMFIMYVY